VSTGNIGRVPVYVPPNLSPPGYYCTQNSQCTTNNCVTYIGQCSANSFGGVCQSNGDCYTLNCTNSQCGLAYGGQSCAANNDCVTQFCAAQPCLGDTCLDLSYCQLGTVGQLCNDPSQCATYNCVNGLCQVVSVGGKCFVNSSCTSQNCFAQTCRANSVGPCLSSSDCTSGNCGPDHYCQGPTGPAGPPVHFGTTCFGLSVYQPASGVSVTLDCSQLPAGFTGAFVLIEEDVECAPGYSIVVTPPPPATLTAGPPPVTATYSCSASGKIQNVVFARGLCCPA